MEDLIVLFTLCLIPCLIVAHLRRKIRELHEEVDFQRGQVRRLQESLWRRPAPAKLFGLSAYDEIVAIGRADLASDVRAMIKRGRQRGWSDGYILEYMIWYIGRDASQEEIVRQMMSFATEWQ